MKYYQMEMYLFLIIKKYMELNVKIAIYLTQRIINALKLVVRFFYINIFVVFWKIINKFERWNKIISYFKKLGLKDDINLYSSIIYQFPSVYPKKFKTYEFPIIEEQLLQDKSITKYEIPQYIQDIPNGFSLFCTLWEARIVKQYIQQSREEQDKLNLIENIVSKDNNNVCFNEPLPKSNFCNLCHARFDDYLCHIESMIHKNNVNQNSKMFIHIKNTFKRINNFWEKRKKK